MPTTARAPIRRLVIPVALLGTLGIGAVGGAAFAGGGLSGAGLSGDADRSKIETIVHDYILAHPEIIPEAMDKLREKRVSQSIDENRAALETPYAGAWDGAADGDVTLVEFFDYACGYCRAAAPDVARLVADDKHLKVVYRELPILSVESVAAARVALYAAEQRKYPAFHKAMFDGGNPGRDGVLAAAAKAGLDRAKVGEILASKDKPEELSDNIALAQALNASGTPLFVVGDQAIYGQASYDQLKAAVAKARAAAKGKAG